MPQLYHVRAVCYTDTTSEDAVFGVTASNVESARRAVESQDWRGYARIEAAQVTAMGATPLPVTTPLRYR